MTRDELKERLDDTLMLSNPRIVPNDLMPDIDAYVQAERERIAQAIDLAADGARGCSRGCASGERRGFERAARIARADS